MGKPSEAGRRVAEDCIARALYCGREWIFMDEPTNNLDVDTVKWLKDFITKIDRRLVFVTHDSEPVEGAQEIAMLGRSA